jgi:general secretion pathway protein D
MTFGNNLGAPQVTLDTAAGFNPNIGILSADGVRATLSFLNTDADTESLATPRAVTMDGIQTELSVVRNVPVFEENLSAGGGGGNAATAVKPNYDLQVGGKTLNEVGIKLLVTPRLQGDSNVFLDLKPEISEQEAVRATETVGGKVSTAPIFSRRRLTTQAVVPDGHTLVLGGLVNDAKSDVNTKVPILGDIPGIGAAFRKSSKERTKRNLVMFVTPTIISKDDYQTGQRPTQFLQTKAAITPDDTSTVWNSAKAEEDWTKPKPQP